MIRVNGVILWKKELLKKLFSNDPDNIDIQHVIELKYKNIPTSLYKYRSFDENGYWIDMLENDLIVISNPKNFNDPYDCAFSFPAEELGIKHFKKNLDGILIKLSSLHKFSPEEKTLLINSENFFQDLILLLQKEYSIF